jgi:large subunit ribosomal protein L2
MYIKKKEMIKKLKISKKRASGRNNIGRITVRNIGGGSKKNYKLVDYYRDNINIIGKVVRIDKDSVRNAKIALISYSNGTISYILNAEGLKENNYIRSGKAIGLNKGDVTILKEIPIGSFVHNIELNSYKGGQLARAAGSYGQILRRKGRKIYVRLKSREIRIFSAECRATIGKVGNVKHKFCKLYKAGQNRWRGKKPSVRGVAKNPVDHPHGGGQGKTKGGRCSVSPWGVLTKGFKTRSRKKRKDTKILKRRDEI